MKRWASIAFLLALASSLWAGAAQAAAPANDNFTAAIPLALGEEVSVSNSGATAEPTEPDPKKESHSWTCKSPAEGPHCSSSIWFTFEVPETGQYTIETCDAGTEPDTALGIYTGTTLNKLALVGEATYTGTMPYCTGGPSGGLGGSRITFEATAGTRYDVYAGGYRGDMGSFWLRSYFGSPKARPTPDTHVIGEHSSAANALHAFQAGTPIASGPRHTPSLAIVTVPPELPQQCSLDGAPYTACEAAVSYDDLPGGEHVLLVRAASGGLVDPTPVVHRFTVDTTPPQTTLLSGPTGGETISTQATAWTYASSERNHGLADGACRVDSQPFSRCVSPEMVEGLCQGPHHFEAAAVDEAANIDPTPLRADFKVPVGAPCTAPTLVTPSSPSVGETEAAFEGEFDSKGAGGALEVLYGTTPSYGFRERPFGVTPSDKPGHTKITLISLIPGTTYHFQLRLTTPFGTAVTPDSTLTTKPASDPLIELANGTPRVIGRYAAILPVTGKTHQQGGSLALLLAQGEPVSEATAARLFSDNSFASGQEEQLRQFPIADLDPATTYHYRFVASSFSTGNWSEGPEGTFTTPPYPPPGGGGGVTKKHFKLRRGNVKVGSLTRSSKKLLVKVLGLPAKTKVTLRLTVGKSKQSARKKAKPNGRARFKPSLSKRIRKALLDHNVKRFKLKVTASPPGEPSSTITVSKRLKG